MKKDYKKEVVTGLCVILALCFLFFGIDYLKGINVFKPANYYMVSYTDVKGLAISAPVNVNGFKVGQVRSIEYEYDNPGHVMVELSLDKALKVPVGSKAVIESDMLGTASVVLKMASATEYHEIGAKLVGETASGMLDGVSENLMPAVSAIFPKVDSLISALNRVVGDPALLSAVKRLDNISANMDATIAKLNSSVSSLPAVMKNVEGTTRNLNELSGSLADLSAKLKEIPLDSTMNNILVLSDNLAKMSEELNNPNSTLGLLMKDPALYNNLNATVGSLDSLLIDVKKNPKRYISIKLL